jgi:hypothetical protein
VKTDSADEKAETPSIPRPQRRLRPDPDDENYEHPPGSVSRKRFAAVFGAASTVVVLAGVSFFSIGMVLGASLGPGLGGFVADFDNVSYTQDKADIYPVVAPHPACEDAPQLEADLEGKTYLKGDVTFYKDMPLPDSFGPNRIARISIVADSGTSRIEVTDLNLRLTALNAENISLGNTTLREFGPNQYDTGDANDSFAPVGNASLNPNSDASRVPEYGIDAETFVLPDGGVAAAHQVTLGSINLRNLDLFVAISDEDNLSNPAPRVVEPNNRTCSSLAESTQS